MKYNTRKVEVDGILFDSKKEAKRYLELKLLQQHGKITDLQLQKTYELIPAQYETFERYGKRGQRLKDGKRLLERPVTYIADFVYQQDGKTIVEDVKGYRNTGSSGYAMFIIKRKLMLHIHGIRIKEV